MPFWLVHLNCISNGLNGHQQEVLVPDELIPPSSSVTWFKLLISLRYQLRWPGIALFTELSLLVLFQNFELYLLVRQS